MNLTVLSGCKYAFLRRHAVGWVVLLGVCSFSTFGQADIIYVANTGNGTIEKITSAGVDSVVGDASNGLQAPWGLAFDGSGNLYAANSDWYNSAITKNTPSGASSVFASSELKAPTGLAFDGSGNLYAANFWSDSIVKITPDGSTSVFASGVSGPRGIAFDGSGNLYAATYNCAIMKFTPSGVSSIFAINTNSYIGGGTFGLHEPMGLAFDSVGNLYVANEGQGNNAVYKYTPDGVGSVFADASIGLDHPCSLAFDSKGNLYVGNYGESSGFIEKITPSGVASVFATGLNLPLGLAITDDAGNPLSLPNDVAVNHEPVVIDNTAINDNSSGYNNAGGQPLALAPEPGSVWALLALGVPVVFGMFRQRLRAA